MDENANLLDQLESAIREQRHRELVRPEPTLQSLRNVYTGHINGYNNVLRMIDRMRKGLSPLKDDSV